MLVDLVRGAVQGAQTAGDVHVLERGGVRGQVRQRRETAERLPEHAPRLGAQVLTDSLSVTHDGIRAQMREMLRHSLGATCQITIADRRGAAGSALIEQHQPVVRERSIHPRRRRGGVERTRRLMARAALQEDQVRQIFSAVSRW